MRKVGSGPRMGSTPLSPSCSVNTTHTRTVFLGQTIERYSPVKYYVSPEHFDLNSTVFWWKVFFRWKIACYSRSLAILHPIHVLETRWVCWPNPDTSHLLYRRPFYLAIVLLSSHCSTLGLWVVNRKRMGLSTFFRDNVHFAFTVSHSRYKDGLTMNTHPSSTGIMSTEVNRSWKKHCDYSQSRYRSQFIWNLSS